MAPAWLPDGTGHQQDQARLRSLELLTQPPPPTSPERAVKAGDEVDS